MMTDMLTGHSREDALETVERVRAMLAGSEGDALEDEIAVAPVAALVAVRRYPSRVKCATLAWEAVYGALADGTDKVTTE